VYAPNELHRSHTDYIQERTIEIWTPSLFQLRARTLQSGKKSVQERLKYPDLSPPLFFYFNLAWSDAFSPPDLPAEFGTRLSANPHNASICASSALILSENRKVNR